MAVQEYKIVVFGDSVAWGQGLAEPEKYSTLVANSIAKRLNVTVQKKVFAHSGATINYDLLSGEDRKYLDKCGERVLDGEIPTAFPTITRQVAEFPEEEANTVDLVLLSGGINDVNVRTILNPSPFSQEEEIRTRTFQSCYKGMSELLRAIDQKFANPRTKIIVTGYFRLVTEETNLTGVASLALYAGVGAATIFLLGVKSFLTLGVFALSLVSHLKEKWLENWRTFYEASNQNLSRAVNEIDNGRRKLLFVYPGIGQYQAAYTHDSHFYEVKVKLGGEYIGLLTVEDSVKSHRISQCNTIASTAGQFCQVSDICQIAAMGHPNRKGARRYATAILAALFPPPPIPAHCVPIADSIQDLEGERNMFQEQLQFATNASEKSFLVRAINRINDQIKQKHDELNQCISNPTPKPTYFSKGGTLTTGPAVGINANGTLEVFARGSDNALYHIWQTSAGGSWSRWTSLGGTLTGAPAVARNSDGRLEVFVRGAKNALYHIWQTSPSGGWSNWTSLGGRDIYDEIDVSMNKNGRLEVFVVGPNNKLLHLWQKSPGRAAWSRWTSLGGTLTGAPAVARNSDGRLEVFARGAKNALYHIWQTSAGGWSRWVSLGGVLGGAPTVDINANGTLEVFARGSDNALYHIWQKSPGRAAWYNWASLGGNLTSNPAVARNSDGRLEVFARGSDNALYHIWQTSPSGGWSSWVRVDGPIDMKIAVSQNKDGRLEIFVRNEKHELTHRWQTSPSNGWI